MTAGSQAELSALLGTVDSLEELDGAVAVVGQPFAGRELVLAHIADRLDGDHLQLGPETTPDTVLDALEDGPVVIENCQHLYSRRIGGFDVLDTVLSAVARRDETVVTGWNSVAWSYLDAVRDIERSFEVHELSSLSGAELGELLRAKEGELPSFRIESGEESLVRFAEVSVEWRDLTVRLPTVDRSAISARFGPETDPETAVFKRLASVSNGNIGVALALWDQQAPAGEVTPGDFTAPSIDVNRDGAFLLRLVLAQETATRTALGHWFDSRFDQMLASLRNHGIVSVDGERVRLEPSGVPAAISVTERHRIL